MPEAEHPPKPGFKTTEFWISLAAVVVGSVVASGAVPVGSVWERIVGLAVAALAALGYTGARLTLKKP
jgi:predicted tellurium resistance membrane protein TerC